jgi:uncharacterized protein (DUF1684 family)
MITKYLFIIFISLLLFACGKSYTPEQQKYVNEIETMRAETNEYMKNNHNSPFNFKGKVKFHDLNYFEVNPEMVFQSKLIEFTEKDTVTIFGTKGEPRKTIRFGYLEFTYQGKSFPLKVYKTNSNNGQTYYSIWFTDQTTNQESYGVGRYLSFEKSDDPNHTYTIDFNKAFNPYCAYSKEYSCAIPTKDDYLDLAIKAGEKKFYN